MDELKSAQNMPQVYVRERSREKKRRAVRGALPTRRGLARADTSAWETDYGQRIETSNQTDTALSRTTLLTELELGPAAALKVQMI